VKAIERIISAAKESGLTKTTPKELLKWFEGKRPYKNDDILDVSHPLWGAELRCLTWGKFGNLVKSANRKEVSTRG
jgi:hypothetical protein